MRDLLDGLLPVAPPGPKKGAEWVFPPGTEDECRELLEKAQSVLGVATHSEALERLVVLCCRHPSAFGRMSEKLTQEHPWPGR